MALTHRSARAPRRQTPEIDPHELASMERTEALIAEVAKSVAELRAVTDALNAELDREDA